MTSFANEQTKKDPVVARSEREALSTEAKPTATTGTLRIELNYSDASPGTNLIVLLAPDGVEILSPSAQRREARSDEAGVVLHEDLEPGRYRLSFPHPSSTELEAQITAGEETLCRITFDAGFSVTGEVVNRQGLPVAGAGIWLSFSQAAAAIAYTDKRGRFYLRDLQKITMIGASARGYAPAPILTLQGNVGAEVEVQLVLQGIGGIVQGQVLDANGAHVPFALVSFPNSDLPWTFLGEGQSNFLTPVRSVTDSDGRFRCEGLPPLEIKVEASAEGKGKVEDRVMVTPGGVTEIVLRLPRTASLHGRVLAADGSPLVDAWIGASSSGDNFLMTRSTAGGDYRLAGLNPGEVRVQVFAARKRFELTLDLAAGEDLERDLQFATQAQIRGRLMTQDGTALASWSVNASGKEYGVAGDTTDDEGRFVLESLAPNQAYRLACSRRRPALFSNHVLSDVYASEEEQVFRLPEAALAEGSIRGRLLDWRGEILTDAQVAAARIDEPRWLPRTLGDDGSFHFKNLPIGRYLVMIKAGPHWTRSAELSLEANQELDLGDMLQPQLGSISLDIKGNGAANAERAKFLDSSHRIIAYATLDQGALVDYPIAPGDYYVQLLGEGLVSEKHSFTVNAGEAARVAVKLR